MPFETLYSQLFAPPPPTPRSMSCMLITVAPVERRPLRIAEMQGRELWIHGPGGSQVEHVELT